MIDEILISAKKLPRVSAEAAEEYAKAIDKLLDHVNEQMGSNPKISELIGRNPLDLMHDNHRNHATFMSTVFNINSCELLARTIPWVYRAYHARGFSYDYFPVELIAWQIAIHECLAQSAHKNEILTIYKWMVQYHEEMVKLSITGEGLSFSVQREANEMQQIFLVLLLHGDTQGCLKLADQSIRTADEVKSFYLDVVWPAMSKIGHMWESNQISVAEEHLATAIVGRVMAALYPRFAAFASNRGTVVVSAGPNEFHEIGARMVADFMEMDGWDVTYLGANTPVSALVEILKRNKPFMVALSVATGFNLDNARLVIQAIREDQETIDVKIMIGGLAFSGMPQLWRDLGADGYAADAENAVTVSNEWWNEGHNDNN
jgi:methanogenic corrinoid protein MtbC1